MNELAKSHNKALYELQEKWKELPQIDTPLDEYFAPGVYVRVIKIPAGTWLIGKTHKTEHLNICLSGKGRVFIAGKEYHLNGQAFIKSFPGEKKLFDVSEEMLWATIHATDIEDIDEIEKKTVMSDDEERIHILGHNLTKEVLECLGQQ